MRRSDDLAGSTDGGTGAGRRASLRDCRLIDLPCVQDARGNLTFIERHRQVPFDFKRVFYLYDVPGGAVRAGHALKTCHQFLIAASGGFDVVIDDGVERRRYQLNRSYFGLYIPPMIWREIDNFSSNSVCMVLASEFYAPSDYYRLYDDYVSAARSPAAEPASRADGRAGAP
jgi:dTDP-4-dehydrorhamnose 3,5-epimerase-like enzyme